MESCRLAPRRGARGLLSRMSDSVYIKQTTNSKKLIFSRFPLSPVF
jgi:hypothetical protein